MDGFDTLVCRPCPAWQPESHQSLVVASGFGYGTESRLKHPHFYPNGHHRARDPLSYLEVTTDARLEIFKGERRSVWCVRYRCGRGVWCVLHVSRIKKRKEKKDPEGKGHPAHFHMSELQTHKGWLDLDTYIRAGGNGESGIQKLDTSCNPAAR